MPEELKKVTPPDPHPILPARLHETWRKDYASEHRKAQVDAPNDTSEQHQRALRFANRHLRTEAPQNFDEGLAFEKWQLVRRWIENGRLKGVTIDGRRFSFRIPAGKEAIAAAAAVTVRSLDPEIAEAEEEAELAAAAAAAPPPPPGNGGKGKGKEKD